MRNRLAGIIFSIIVSVSGSQGLSGADIVRANGIDFSVERGFPEELLATYDFNAPAGPEFTEAEIAQQYARGDKLEDMIYAAYASGQSELVIPPGDYRLRPSGTVPLKPERHGTISYPCYLSIGLKTSVLRLCGLRRGDDNPLHIIGKGVTLWFTPTGEDRPSMQWGILLDNCANLIFDGFTIDAAKPCSMGGRVTQVDTAGWKLEVELGKHSSTNLAQINDRLC